MSLVIDCVLIDCVDLDAMTAFWCQALDLEHVWTGPSGGHLLTATDGSGRRLALMPSHSAKTAKNRIHFDLRPDGDQQSEVRRLESLGARRIDIGQGDVTWVVMADPEGNEFCVLRSLAEKATGNGAEKRDDVTIRLAEARDIPAITTIAIDTEMFDADGATFVDDIVTEILDGTLRDHHFVVSEGSDGRVIGAAYFAPEPFSDRMWNLYFIAVHPSQQGNGIGGALLDHVERHLQHAGPEKAQVLIVETTSTDQYARTRDFYPKLGYVEEARIRRFYGPDDDKVVYWKLLTT